MPRLFGPNTSGGAYAEGSFVAAPATTVTISAWFRATAATGAWWVFSVADSAVQTNYYGILVRGDVAGDPVGVAKRAGGSFIEATSLGPGGAGFSVGTWHHIVGIIDFSAPSMRAYLDGVAGSPVATAGTPTSLDVTSIGRVGDSTPDNPFDGDIGHVAVWPDTILTAEEIAALAAGADERTIRPGVVRPIPLWGIHDPEPVLDDVGDTLTLFNSPAQSDSGPPVSRRLIVPIEFQQAAGTTKSVADNAAGADAVSVSASVAVAESGSGADANPSLGAELAIAESGAGADANPSVSALALIAEVGTGADGAPTINVSLAVAESGAGGDTVDVETAGSEKSVSDTGAGSDAAPQISVAALVADAGAGGDSAQASVASTVADEFSGAEQVTIAVDVAIADSGAGAETIAAAILALVADVGAGVDSIGVSTETEKSVSDTGAGSDQVLAATVVVNLADACSAEEFVAVLAQLLVAESGSASEGITRLGGVVDVLIKERRVVFRTVREMRAKF